MSSTKLPIRHEEMPKSRLLTGVKVTQTSDSAMREKILKIAKEMEKIKASDPSPNSSVMSL